MDRSLSDELLQLQRSRCGLKYAEYMDVYVRDIPERVSNSIKRPIRSINKRFSILARYRGRMLYNLEKSFYRTLYRLRNQEK